MDVKNIYYVNGDINSQGLYEKKPGSIIIIAECKENDLAGLSYYAFRSLNSETSEESNNNMIKIRSLMSLIDEQDIEVQKVNSEEQFKRLKAYFMTILENKKILKESNLELLKK